MDKLIEALKSDENMDAYLEAHYAEDIIKDIKEYAKTNSDTLTRQQFAAMAMQGIISKHGIIENDPGSIARDAIRFVDALIKELNKEKP
jgi:ADP-glucose pyrophosphorylase